MKNCTKIYEFKNEAQNALFTKRQAIAVITHLLEQEAADNVNHTPDEQAALAAAAKKINFSYVDFNHTETDNLLDSFDVARITAEDIVNALDVVVFEVE